VYKSFAWVLAHEKGRKKRFTCRHFRRAIERLYGEEEQSIQRKLVVGITGPSGGARKKEGNSGFAKERKERCAGREGGKTHPSKEKKG